MNFETPASRSIILVRYRHVLTYLLTLATLGCSDCWRHSSTIAREYIGGYAAYIFSAIAMKLIFWSGQFRHEFLGPTRKRMIFSSLDQGTHDETVRVIPYSSIIVVVKVNSCPVQSGIITARSYDHRAFISFVFFIILTFTSCFPPIGFTAAASILLWLQLFLTSLKQLIQSFTNSDSSQTKL